MTRPFTPADNLVLHDLADIFACDIIDLCDLPQPLDSHLLQRIQLLVGDIEVDLDLALSAEDE